MMNLRLEEMIPRMTRVMTIRQKEIHRKIRPLIRQMVLLLEAMSLQEMMILQMIPMKIPLLTILQMKIRTKRMIQRKMARRMVRRNRKRNSRWSLSMIFSLRPRQR